MLVATVGPDFDGSTVAGGIDLISQTAASWEGGGGRVRKGEGVCFTGLCFVQQPVITPPHPPSTQEVQTSSDSLSEILKKGRRTQKLKNRGKVRNK